MTWPLWKKESEDGHPPTRSRPSTLQVHQSTDRNSIPDTVDSFKLEPSNKTPRFNLRKTQMKFSSNILRLRRHTSTAGIFFEPSSITEYKRLKYITNRDIHRRQSTASTMVLGAKSGVYDKHCVFVSITGITIKLSLGQRRPVEPGTSGSRLTWSGLRARDRLPRYASSASYFSFKMSEASQSKQRLTNEVAFYMAKDQTVTDDSVDPTPNSQTLRRSLQLQANTLDSHFSSTSSVASSKQARPNLSFVWDEMGLSLRPLSSNATSLYEVLTKDQARLKGAPKVKKQKSFQSTILTEGETASSKVKSEKKTSKSWVGKKRSSSFGHDNSVHLDSPTQTKKKDSKKLGSLKNKSHDKPFPASNDLLTVPNLKSKSRGALVLENSTIDSTDHNFPRDERLLSGIIEDDILLAASGDKQPVRASSMPEEIQDSMAQSKASSLEALGTEVPHQKRLYTKTDLDIEPGIPSEEPIMLSRTSSDYQSPISSTTSTDYNSALPSRVPSDSKSALPPRTRLDYKSASTTSTEPSSNSDIPTETMSELRSRTPLKRPSSDPPASAPDKRSPRTRARTPADYTSVLPTKTTSEKPFPPRIKILSEEPQTPQTTIYGADVEEGERFYDCISLEGTKSCSSTSDTGRPRRRFVSRLLAPLRSAVAWLSSHVIAKGDREKRGDDGKDSNDDSDTIYFSPRSSSQPELDNISNSNSAPQIWVNYWEICKAQLELKELWADNAKVKQKRATANQLQKHTDRESKHAAKCSKQDIVNNISMRNSSDMPIEMGHNDMFSEDKTKKEGLPREDTTVNGNSSYDSFFAKSSEVSGLLKLRQTRVENTNCTHSMVSHNEQSNCSFIHTNMSGQRMSILLEKIKGERLSCFATVWSSFSGVIKTPTSLTIMLIFSVLLTKWFFINYIRLFQS